MPGGESTTMLKLLRYENLFDDLAEFGRAKPIFGTCAGAILMAKDVTNPAQESLGLIDIEVERNAYGRQIDSRVVEIEPAPEFEKRTAPGQLEAVFIRAPIIRRSMTERARAGRIRGRPGAGRAGPPPGRDVPPGADEGSPGTFPVPGDAVIPTPKKRVLFVCIGNACRSQMAEAFARAYGSDVADRRQRRCLLPRWHVATDTIRAMEEKNIDIRDHFPKSLRHLGRAEFDLVVNMSGMFLPATVGEHVVDWEVADPVYMDYSEHCEIRDDIEQRVMKLVLELRRAPRTQFRGQGSGRLGRVSVC